MSSSNYFRDASDGCSELIYSETKQTWICGGSLGQLFVYDSNDSSFQSKDLTPSNTIHSLALNQNETLIALALGDLVSIRDFSNVDNIDIDFVGRRTLPVTHVAFNSQGSHLFISSKEADILVYSMKDQKIEERIATNDLGIRYFALSPNEKLLATVNMKGAVTIYSINHGRDPLTNNLIISKDKMETHHVGLVHTSILSNDATGFKFSWLNDDSLLIPSMKGSITVLSKSTGSWQEAFLTSADDNLTHGTADLNLIEKITPNVFFSCDIGGKILLWKFNGENFDVSMPILSWQSPFDTAGIYDLSYHKTKNMLFLVSSTDYTVIENVLKNEERDELQIVPTVAVIPPAPSSKPMNNDNNDNDEIDDALLANFDLDAYTTKEAVPMEETLVDSFPIYDTQAEPSQMEIAEPSPEKKLSKLSKNNNNNDGTTTKRNDDDDEDSHLFDEPAAKQKNRSLGSLLAAPTASPAVPKAQIRSLFDDEAEEGDDVDDDDLKGKKNKKGGATADDDDDDMLLDEEDDVDDLLQDGEEGIALSTNDSNVLMKEILKLKKQLKTKDFLTENIPSHPIIHSSSTPFDEKRGRYLVWNHIGNITLREEGIDNRIEIRFTDINYHKNEIIPDRNGITMAALSADGAAFATIIQDDLDKTEEEKKRKKLLLEDLHEESSDLHAKGSIIYYHAFQNLPNTNNNGMIGNSLDGVNQTFRIQLLGREEVETIAAGKGFIAVTTSKNYLRIYNTIGMEMMVTQLKGKIISLLAYDNQLVLIYNTSNAMLQPFNGIYSLSLDLYEINWKNYFKMNCLLSQFPLPFYQSKQKLEWIGYDTDQKIVLLLDSLGNLNALMNIMNYQWIPILHIPSIRKSIDHKYWPIMIKNSKLIYVLLNGEKKPALSPQPVVSMKAIKVPLSSITHLTLVNNTNNNNNNNNNKEKDQKELQNKEKLYSFFYETLKIHHYENLLNEKNSSYLLNYYHTNPMESNQDANQNNTNQNNLEKISIYENHELPILSHMTNEMIQSYDKTLLTLFQEAIVSGQLNFALSLIYQIRSLISLQTAIVIANHFGKRSLAERIDFILQHKLTMITDQQQQQQQQQQMMMATGGPSQSRHHNDDDDFLNKKNHHRHEDEDDLDRQPDEEQNEPQNNILSRKASNMKPPISSKTNKTTAVTNNKVVTPPAPSNNNHFDEDAAYLSHDDGVVGMKKEVKKSLNPFKVEKTGNTPLKRKSVMEDLNEHMKYSPSPKKPALSRMSTFSQNARKEKFVNNKSFI